MIATQTLRVVVVADPGNADGTMGGAELTMQEFASAKPAHVTLVDELADADVAVIGNCVHVAPSVIDALEGKRVVRYHNDLARREHPELREWLEGNAVHVFTSPFHQELYGLGGEWPNIPPALKLSRYKPGKATRGAVAVAPWQNLGKGQVALHEWSVKHDEPVDVYGPGPFQPEGPLLRLRGPLEPGKVAATLRKYRTFVHLPTEPEPFGRTVVEAWASGCRVVTNELVGAVWWIRENPQGLRTAATDFWKLVAG